jgi:DNA-directed RNA polymerase specialized sigma24 family protein
MYDELRELANRQLENNTRSPTLGPTVLVHELFLKLHRHSFDSLPRDHLRQRHALSRGGGRRRVSLEHLDLSERGITFDADQVEHLDQLLTSIAEQSREADQAIRVFRMQFYMGLTLEQCATALGISKATALRRAHFARAAVRRKLSDARGTFDGHHARQAT